MKDINNKKVVTCGFFLKTTSDEITRAKRHQIGVKGFPHGIRLKIKEAHEKRRLKMVQPLGWKRC